MTVEIRSWDVSVGHRVDGEPWKVRFIELEGSAGGPTTAFIAGIYGDKPLGCLAIHELRRRLAGSDLKGRVILVPAANPPAFGTGTRISPDHLYLNRRFPGSPTGFVTDQIAHAIFTELVSLADCVIDLQPGTPVTAMRYIYDYGDPEFTASFGYLPMFVGRPIEGQLSVVAAAKGLKSSLPEFSGGPVDDLSTGVEGCLNVLRYRGQLGGRMTGPKKLPVIRRWRSFHPSTAGILQYRYGPADVGKPVTRGLLGWVADIFTGARAEEFVLDEDGAILLLATTTPATTQPGNLGLMIGFPESEIEVPQV